MKSEVEYELAETRANLAEVTKAKEALQQELNKDKSLKYETPNKLSNGGDNGRQKDEVCDKLKSELNTLRETAYSVKGNSLQSWRTWKDRKDLTGKRMVRETLSSLKYPLRRYV